MRPTAALAAAAVLAAAAPSFAVISFGITYNGDLVNFYAYTTGDTGTRIVSYDLAYAGSPVQFVVLDDDGNGTPDTAEIAGTSAPTSTYFRIGTAAQTFVNAASPSNGFAEPNPYLNPIGNFSVGINSNGTVTGFDTISTSPGVPNGRVFARLNIPGLQALIASTQFNFALTGQMQGSAGGPQPVALGIPEPAALGTVGVIAAGLLARRRSARVEG